jgi:hypothetical protein
MQVKIVLRSTARSIACRFVVPGAWFFAPPVSCPTGFFKEETTSSAGIYLVQPPLLIHLPEYR